MRALPLALAGLLALAPASCRPDDDDTVSNDDDSAVDDDDSAGQPDDDDVTPDPACTDGWEPLAILDDFEANIHDYSVDPGSSTLAAITERYLYVYDLSEPRTPALLETFDVREVVEPAAEWVAISAAEGGHVVLGRWQDETGAWAQVQVVDAVGGGAGLSLERVFLTGAPDKDGTPELAWDISARGVRSAVTTGWWKEATVYFLELDDSALVLEGSRALPAGGWDRIAYTGDAVLMPSYQRIRVVPFDSSSEIRSLDIGGSAQIPLETEHGWFIPTISHSYTTPPLYLLNDALLDIHHIGETEVGCYLPKDDLDGAHQATVYEGEIFVANGCSGLLRADWTPDDWVSVAGPTTLTQEVWEDAIEGPVPEYADLAFRVERVEDVLAVGGSWYLGLVRICPL